MTITQWPSNVNSRFFKLKRKLKDNVVITQMDSGRTVGFKKNEQDFFEYSLSVQLNKTNGELNRFWTWYSSTLGGTAGWFTCAALSNKYGTHTYRFTQLPEPENTNQKIEILNLNIEEVL